MDSVGEPHDAAAYETNRRAFYPRRIMASDDDKVHPEHGDNAGEGGEPHLPMSKGLPIDPLDDLSLLLTGSDSRRGSEYGHNFGHILHILRRRCLLAASKVQTAQPSPHTRLLGKEAAVSPFANVRNLPKKEPQSTSSF